MEPFLYDELMPGHALQKMLVEKKIATALKKFCTANKCQPVKCATAHYAFMPEGNTYHYVAIEVAPGKGDVRKWLKAYDLGWKFGAASEEAHEA